MHMTMRVVRIMFVINGGIKPARPSGTTKAGAIVVGGEMFNRRWMASLIHAKPKHGW